MASYIKVSGGMANITGMVGSCIVVAGVMKVAGWMGSAKATGLASTETRALSGESVEDLSYVWGEMGFFDGRDLLWITWRMVLGRHTWPPILKVGSTSMSAGLVIRP
jgi:hypothetical protein